MAIQSEKNKTEPLYYQILLLIFKLKKLRQCNIGVKTDIYQWDRIESLGKKKHIRSSLFDDKETLQFSAEKIDFSINNAGSIEII